MPDGAVRVHADLGEIATFYANDMVVAGAGRAYVGNFGFDLAGEMASRGAAAVMAAPGLADLALVHPDGRVEVVARDLKFPNGSVITPDGKTLIVGETFGAVLTAFDIAADGTLSNRRVWASLAPRVPDGIALDAENCVWFANPLAPECVRVAEGGEVLEVIAPTSPAMPACSAATTGALCSC